MLAILTTKITVQQLIFNQIKGIYKRKPVFKKRNTHLIWYQGNEKLFQGQVSFN